MKTLVFYVSLGGDHYYNKTSKCIETLVKVGKYEGDIIVLTDSDGFSIDIENQIEFINCKNKIKIKYNEEKHNIRYYRNIKSFVTQFVDISKYDVVLYLDSDVLVNKNVDEIFETSINENKIIVQKDVGNVDKRKMIDGKIKGPTLGADVLNEEQINYLHGNGFCTGVLCVPFKHFDVLRYWHAKNIIENLEKSDQGNFHWVVANYKLLDDIKYVHAYPFGNQSPEQLKEKVFLHYWTEENQKFKSRYLFLVGNTKNILDAKMVVINLENERDRLETFKNTMKDKNFSYEIFSAKRMASQSGLSSRQFGCRDSHLQIFKDNKNSTKNILIMEDDIYFHPEFDKLILECNENFNRINTWDVIYFYNSMKNKFKFNKNDIFTPGRTDGCYFYLINKDSIDKIYDLIYPINKPIDWAFRQIIHEGKISAYVCKYDVVRARLLKHQKENYT